MRRTAEGIKSTERAGYKNRIRKWVLLLCFLLIFQLSVPVQGEAALHISPMQEEIRPGLAVVISYVLPEAGECDLVLRSEDGEEVSVISKGHYAYAGANTIHWNGTYNGVPAPEGTWRLCLEKDGNRAETSVTVGPMAPCLVGVAAADSVVISGETLTIHYYATSPGILAVYLAENEEREMIAGQETAAGDGMLTFTVIEPGGQHNLVMTLTDGEGITSEEYSMTVTVLQDSTEEIPPEETDRETETPDGPDAAETPAVSDEMIITETVETPAPDITFTPAYTSPWDGKDTSVNYWTTPMDIKDEAAVWAALIAPVTVIDNGKGEKAQIILRAGPDQNSEGLGSVTCETQGVHVLERGEEWSLIECYSSSFHDSPVLNWNALVQGYVLTKYLKEVTPNQNLGYVIDKLTQRLYVFQDGHLFTTLLVSTGLSNQRQPYNETRSGEFLMTSKVGTFKSDNLRCGMAIRFNKGDLLHEVPYTLLADGTANYKNCEPKLGTKASHGCIRVQRKRTPEGVNMGWIWNNQKKNTKLIIWEDWQGRQIEIPSDDTLLYYNPNGGKYYHSAEHCNSVIRAGIKFESFSYGQLDEEPYSELERCEYCTPVLRRAEIEAINEVYAFGGDHDPVLTEARETCPRTQR